jgi:CheY-like chemotaxis protein
VRHAGRIIDLVGLAARYEVLPHTRTDGVINRHIGEAVPVVGSLFHCRIYKLAQCRSEGLKERRVAVFLRPVVNLLAVRSLGNLHLNDAPVAFGNDMKAEAGDRRILVVEDEMLIAMMIEGMLNDLGCKSVATAATVDQAVTLIEGQDFDAAMLDVNLKGSNSYPVADVLAARGVPYFFSTGNSGNMADGYGDRAVLRKPFMSRDLATMFRELLSLSERNFLPKAAVPA